MNPTPRELCTTEIGYLSLALCIMTTKTVDQALNTIAPDPDADLRLIRKQENEDIIALHEKQHCTWKEIGEIFNVDDSAVFKRAKRYREKCG